jgi:hypothetical protein
MFVGQSSKFLRGAWGEATKRIHTSWFILYVVLFVVQCPLMCSRQLNPIARKNTAVLKGKAPQSPGAGSVGE